MNPLQLQVPTSSHPTDVADLGVRRAGSTCRLCNFRLKREDGDNLETRLCASCKVAPEAAELAPLSGVVGGAGNPFRNLLASACSALQGKAAQSRSFNEADLALIRKIGAFMPAARLLDILNDRLLVDLGTDDGAYTPQQLNEAILSIHGAGNPAAMGRDWPSVRKLLAQARRAGVLDLVHESSINDFAVVFQLNAKQVVELKDIVLGAKEE